jgi:hypothetical protein
MIFPAPRTHENNGGMDDITMVFEIFFFHFQGAARVGEDTRK